MRYYFSDHLGSASVITYNTGVIRSELDYYPYGGEIVITSGDTNHYKFTGKERDSESGLDNFGARYDSSALGRFMTPDWAAKPTTVPYAKFGDPQTLNLYSYVENAPINTADADGHYVCNGDQCQDVKDALNNIKEASKSKDLGKDEKKELKKVLKFYGKAGKDNGVTVNTGTAGVGANGGTRTTDGRTTISLNLSNWDARTANLHGGAVDTEKAASVAHEGEHGIQQKHAGMPTSEQQVFHDEQQAYKVQSDVNKGLEDTSAYGTWSPQGGFSQQAIDRYATGSTQMWCGCNWTPPEGGQQ